MWRLHMHTIVSRLLAQRVGREVDGEIPVQLHVAVGTACVRIVVCVTITFGQN